MYMYYVYMYVFNVLVCIQCSCMYSMFCSVCMQFTVFRERVHYGVPHYHLRSDNRSHSVLTSISFCPTALRTVRLTNTITLFRQRVGYCIVLSTYVFPFQLDDMYIVSIFCWFILVNKMKKI